MASVGCFGHLVNPFPVTPVITFFDGRGEAALDMGERSAPKAHDKTVILHFAVWMIVVEGYDFIVKLAVLDLLCNPLKCPFQTSRSTISFHLKKNEIS